MGNSKRKLRILSFLGVLVLSGGLLMGLFQEARAVSISVADPSPSTTSNGVVQIGGQEVTFTVSVDVPQGERLPIESLRAVVEETQQSGPDQSNKVSPTVLADASCSATPGPGADSCPTFDTLTIADADTTDAIRSIEFAGGSPGDLQGYGYDLCSVDPDDNDNECEVTHPGYEFTDGRGYGYTRPELVGQGYDINDVNAGYGYQHGTLTLNWDVTVDGDRLGNGNFWLTFIVDTGSSVIGQLQGEAKYFEVDSNAGGGGGGGGGVADRFIDADVGEEFDIDEAGQTVKLTGDLPNGLREIGLTFNQACDDCSVTVTRSTAPPSGASQMAPGFRAIYFLDIQVKDADGNTLEGYISGGWILFDVGQDELPGQATPPQILMLRDDEGWGPLDSELTSDEDADPLEYNATVPGFSFFAVVADDQAPTISNNMPTGSTSSVTPQIKADWSDNRGIDTSSLLLTVDGTEESAQTGSLRVTQSGFSFVPAQALDKGEHDVSVEIADTSGLTTTKEWTFRVSEVTCPQPPRITKVEPASGATDVDPTTQIQVFIQKGTCPIATSEVKVNGQTISSTLSGNVLSADIPSEAAGETVSVTATVVDTGENTARKGWSFDTAEAEEPTPTPEDGGALVWVIIALVILAIIGVGAYFYTQQEGAGDGPGGGPGGP